MIEELKSIEEKLDTILDLLSKSEQTNSVDKNADFKLDLETVVKDFDYTKDHELILELLNIVFVNNNKWNNLNYLQKRLPKLESGEILYLMTLLKDNGYVAYTDKYTPAWIITRNGWKYCSKS